MVFVGVLIKYDFLLYFIEYVWELLKYCIRGEEVEFYFVYNIEKFFYKDLFFFKDLKLFNYKLDLWVNLIMFKYNGVVKIKIVCDKIICYVIFYCGDLDVLYVFVKRIESS